MIWSEFFGPWKRIWKSCAPHKCCFFMWLVAPAHNMCWIANRLAQRGLPHPEHCPLCDQHEETLNQLLTCRRNTSGGLPRGMPTVVDESVEVRVRELDGDTERKRQRFRQV